MCRKKAHSYKKKKQVPWMKSGFFFSEVPLVLTMFFFLTTQAPVCCHTVKEPIRPHRLFSEIFISLCIYILMQVHRRMSHINRHSGSQHCIWLQNCCTESLFLELIETYMHVHLCIIIICKKTFSRFDQDIHLHLCIIIICRKNFFRI